MSDLMKRIAMIAQQNDIEKSSLKNLQNTARKRKEWDDDGPQTVEEKKAFIKAVLKAK